MSEFNHCELLPLEADSSERGPFWNREDGEIPPLEADTKQRE
jgi:hypothetical protein